MEANMLLKGDRDDLKRASSLPSGVADVLVFPAPKTICVW
jgi:hypothetical protein